MKKLKVDVITNSGIANLDTEFEVLFSQCDEIRIATAFISKSTIKLIENYLRLDKESNRMMFITGLYGGFNSKSDLQELIRLVKKYPGNLSVRISRNAVFHWKYYSFQSQNRVTEFVGSANFTSNGLNNPGELIVKLTGSSSSREIKILNSEFEKIWKRDSIDILLFPIDKYVSRKVKVIESTGFKSDPFFNKLLYKPKRKRKFMLELNQARCHLDVVDGVMLNSSEAAIFKKKSSWDIKGYELICSKYKKEFNKWQKANYILKFYITDRTKLISLYEVMDWCELRTEDGNYFVAIKKLKRTGSKQLKSLNTKNKLKSIGLKNTKSQDSKWLNKAQTKTIFEYFGLK